MFTPQTDCIGRDFYVNQFLGFTHSHPIFSAVYYGRLPETVAVTPSYRTQTIGAGALNRYIESVSVSRIPVVISTVDLAVAATATYTFSGASTASSADEAVATAEIAAGVVAITGVAAGTTDVTISDASGNTIATVTVTVA
jgi:hypothetical protein